MPPAPLRQNLGSLAAPPARAPAGDDQAPPDRAVSSWDGPVDGEVDANVRPRRPLGMNDGNQNTSALAPAGTRARSMESALAVALEGTRPRAWRTLLPSLAGCLVAFATGCQAQIDGDRDGEQPNNSQAGSSSMGGGGTPAMVPVDITDIIGVDPQQLPDGVPSNGRVLRLSYDEYDRVLGELLHLPVEESKNFPDEQSGLGAYIDYAGLRVGERLYAELVRSATALAARVVGSPEAYGAVVGCAPAESGCRDRFIDGFGLRALRRPLSSSEQARYRTLFDRGAELIGSGDAFRDGVQLTLEAMLQSPKFLYRVEVGSGASDAHGTRLTGFELATRLAFMLSGTTPDAELLAAARDGALDSAEGLALQARRLVALPAFGERVVSFHERWMQLEELSSLAKDPMAFPSFSPALVSSMRSETERFIRTVTLEGNGTVSALLSSRFGFADQGLAALYGLTGTFGSELVRVEHPPESGRLGLFTQAAFLSGHSSSSSGTSPILRGVFLLRRVACVSIPDPPPGAQNQEPTTQPASEIRTTREYFSWKTSMSACTGCHAMINPTGFAFEQFDGLGRWRTEERGAAIDASGTLQLGTKALTFQSASELLDALSKEPQVQACYAKNWLQYSYGRQEQQADLRALGLATQALQSGTFSIRDLAVALTERPAFNHLPPKAE